jgi:hypothetical protein
VAQTDLVATFAYDLAVSDDDAADRIHASLGFTFARQGDCPPHPDSLHAMIPRRKPKLSPIAKGLLKWGLMRLDTSQRLPRLFFTEAGLAELRTMMADRRLSGQARRIW